MKKFLVGIVTLVAAVVLSSPAFGALQTTSTVDLSSGFGVNGLFTFDYDGQTVFVAKLDLPNLGDDTVKTAILDEFKDDGLEEIYYQKIDSNDISKYYDGLDGKTGHIDFNPAVNVILAKWSTNEFGFYIPEGTNYFEWAELDGGMSHVGFSQVPVPAAVWLLGSGVLGLVAVRRRRS